MNVQVHTYSQPKEWAGHPLYASFPDALHICATSNQKNGIKACYGKEFAHIYSFREFIKTLYKDWYSAETKFQQYLRLTKIIADLPDTEPELKRSFRINAMDILDSIRFMLQSNLKPQALQDDWLKTGKERMFKKVWEEFFRKDGASITHYAALQKPISTESIKKSVSILGENKSKLTGRIHIVLHGFYFVTPEQQIVLEILRKQGMKITFFHYYDRRYQETFDFIKAFVTDRFGWPSPNQWTYENSNNLRVKKTAHTFLSAYEEGKADKVRVEETVTSYYSFFDFLQNRILPNFPVNGKRKNKVSIISPKAGELNELLLSYYPELNHKKRNFLSYPIGRFLVDLHQVYSKGELHLNNEILMSLFSSGWLYDEVTNENAQNYTYDLQQVFPYFQNCRTVDDWLFHINQLIDQGLVIEKAFPVSEENRIIRSVRSPFAKISHFSVPLDRLDQIKMFIEKINFMADGLFKHSSVSNTIDAHFARLKDVLRKHSSGVNLIADQNEKKLIQELDEKINLIRDNSEFLYDDIQEALHFYLSGKLDENDENYINGFVEIDGEMFKNQNNPVYITGLDEKALPLGGPEEVPWPLQPETFERLSEQHTVLQLNTIRSRAGKHISRYLFFIALNLPSKNVELSWIKNVLDENELQPAIYIKQLGLKIAAPVLSKEAQNTEYTPHDFSKETVDKSDLSSGWETLEFEDFLAEYTVCPKRFYYSYIVGEHPTFSNDFLHSFQFTELIKTAGQTKKSDFEVVFNEVSQLFPQWLSFTKRVSAKTSFKYVSRKKGEQTEVTDGHYYTETRKNFQFPGFTKEKRENVFVKTRSSASAIVQNLKDPENTVMPAAPSYECRFCPHIKYCDKAVYSIDLKKGE